MENELIKFKNVNKDVLFNLVLYKNLKIIKKLIKNINPSYKISAPFMQIVNGFVDYDKKGNIMYPGLIVRTNLIDYAVLYLEDSKINEDYMIAIITEFINDIDEFVSNEFNVTKFLITKKDFQEIYKNFYE